MRGTGASRAGRWRGVLCAVAAAVLVVTGPFVARANPTPAGIEAQIDKEWNQLEPVIEQYNDVHGKLKKLRAQQAALQKQLAPLQAQVDAAMSQVREMAVDSYMQGAPNALGAMVVSGKPTALADKLTFLDQIARDRRESISSVARLRDKFAADKEKVDKLAAEIATRDADLAGRKKTIEKKINDLQKLRIQAYGTANVNDGPLRTGPCPVAYTNDKGGRAAQKACDLIGKPYVFGANGPNSYDCSGLTQEAWGAVGVHLEHYTKDQWRDGTPVSRAELKPGDLVFYYADLHHVALYIGGDKVVHAPHTGDHVRMAPINRGPISGYRRPA